MGARRLTLDPHARPGQNLDLDDWKVQLPVDRDGGYSGAYTEAWNLDTYESEWFRTGPDGALVLTAPVEGATTSGSNYARSELRETVGDANAAWSLAQGGKMAVTMQVDAVPTLANGAPARVCVGQINSESGQLVRLYWDDGTLYWVNGRNEAQPKDATYRLLDAGGHPPAVALDETFTYRIEVVGGRLTVSVEADGTLYSSTIQVGPGWDDNALYFKAGLYLATNEATSSGRGQVSIFGLDVTHDGSDPVVPGGPTTTPTQPPTQPPAQPAAISDHGAKATLVGTAHDDTFEVGHRKTEVRAGAGFDTVRASVDWKMEEGEERLELTGTAALKGDGSRGDDQMVGNAGANALDGDDGNDLIQGGAGNDAIRGEDGRDRLEGGVGDDALSGGDDEDALFGGDGADRIEGGREADTLFGGAGVDRFVFLSDRDSRAGEADRIGDFQSGQDVIDLSAIDANSKVSGNQAFAWGGSGIGHLALVNGHLVADLNGDGRADLDIDLGGAAVLASDVLL